MRLSVLVLAVAVTVVVAQEQTTFSGLRGAIEPRLAASGIRLARLDYQVRQMEEEIEEAGKVNPMGFVLEMHARLDQVEGSNCRKNHMQCGWESFDCVANLMICDGHKDCYNGWDESDEVCNAGPIIPGNVFTGMANWERCLPLREHPITLKITGAVTSKLFPGRLGVRAHLVADVPAFDIHREGTFRGAYMYGKKRLVLVPTRREPGRFNFGIVCLFNHGDNERADCRIVFEGSLQKCADIRLNLESHEAHYHMEHGQAYLTSYDDHRGETVEHHWDLEGHDHAEQIDNLW